LELNIDPIQNQSLKALCVQKLEHLILSGELETGQKLPSERNLASSLNVSRPVLHEALVDLSAKGLVDIHPRRGVFIANFRKNGSFALLDALLNYSEGELDSRFINSLIAMRMLFETENARLAAANRSDTHLQKFQKIIAKEVSTSLTLEEKVSLDFEFHLLIALASGNDIYPLIINSFKNVYTNITRKFFIVTETNIIQEVYTFHQHLVSAIEAQNSEESFNIMKKMLEHGEHYLRQR
jgi:DNA-binding FadR family transcriptional regulator